MSLRCLAESFDGRICPTDGKSIVDCIENFGIGTFGPFDQSRLDVFELSEISYISKFCVGSRRTVDHTADHGIITGDEKALTCAQGIGKKIAQRVILELKDKLAKGQSINAAGETYAGTGVTVIPENKLSEATAALAVLGYSQGEINLALKGIDLDGLPLEQVIKQALKKMVKG